MTVSETASDPHPRPAPAPLRPPSDAARDARVGPRRLLFALVLLGLGLLVGGVTPLIGGAENVIAARMGIAILLLTVGLVLLARRPSLAAAGLGVLLGLLLHANPYYGDRSTQWPWQLWLSSDAFDHQLDIALWVAAASLALVRAYLGRGHALLVLAVLLSVMAVIRNHAQGGGVPLIRNEEHLDLTWTLGIAALGTSSLLFARGAVAGRRGARALAVLGTALAVTIYLAWFPVSVGGSMAQHYYWRAGQAWETLVTTAEASPQVREGVLKDVLGRIAPFWCFVAALPALLLASLFPRPTRFSRVLGALALGLMLLRWVVPALSEFYFQREFLSIRGPSLVCAIIGDALTGAGLAAWLLLSSCASLALAGGGADRRPANPGFTPRPASRIPYAAALALLLVALYAAFNPQSGTVVMAWPWDLRWVPFWTPPTAGLVLGGISIAGLLAALLSRPGPVRALVALGGLLVGMAALAGPDPKAYLYGVRPLVPPTLLALAVGGAVAVRSGRGGSFAKGLAWVAVLYLLAILFYPLPLVGRGGTDAFGYRSTVGGIALGLKQARTAGGGWDFLTSTYSPGLVILSLGVLILAGLAARRPGPRPIALWGLFVITLAYPSLHTAWATAADPLSRVGGPVEEFLRRIAQDVNVYYLPQAIGIAAVTAELLGWRRPATPEPLLAAAAGDGMAA